MLKLGDHVQYKQDRYPLPYAYGFVTCDTTEVYRITKVIDWRGQQLYGCSKINSDTILTALPEDSYKLVKSSKMKTPFTLGDRIVTTRFRRFHIECLLFANSTQKRIVEEQLPGIVVGIHIQRGKRYYIIEYPDFGAQGVAIEEDISSAPTAR